MRRDLLVAPLHLRAGPGRPSCRLRLLGFAGLSLLIGLGPRLARLPVTLRSNGADVNLVLAWAGARAFYAQNETRYVA